MRAVFIAAVFAAAPVAFAQDYALDAPSEAHIRQGVEVSWTAPEGESGILEIRPEAGGRRASYAYTQNNPQTIEAPEAPGGYLLVLSIGNEDRATSPLTVMMAEASLSAPDTAAAGEDFELSWTGPASRSDNITWAERGGELVRGTSYFYVGADTEGSRNLRAPAGAGDYDIVYVTGSTILARHPITVGSVTATLDALSSIHAGGMFEVAFEGPANSGDLITFADRDGNRRSDLGSYVYVDGTEGSVTLTAAEILGEFDVIYFSNGGIIGRAPIEIVAASVEIDGPGEAWAGLRFNVYWDGNGNSGDRIFVAGPDGREYDYSYIDPMIDTVEIEAPGEVGDYTLVYESRNGQEMDREPLTVVPAPNPPGQLVVTQARVALGSGDAVEIILDASGSMLQRLGGERRIAIAKATLTELVTDTIPEGTGFALRVFGHRESDSCRTDLEIPLGPLDPSAAAAAIDGINAMNLARTPIADSIRRVPSDLEGITGQRVLIVLTDGEETCDGDPAAAIQALRNVVRGVRVNIVGFAIDDADLERTFESWATAGGGRYFSAADAEGLGEAMTRAVATWFEVLDEDGVTIATGVTGSDPITLPTGDYRVVARGGEVPVTIVSDEVTTVALE
ncbi:VWA domain-containing protein [Hyphobacterium sp. SN044]|uniref:vWA domain-containing protein n=1 Tax=Hyphobacterium sp. SN044 TaxID=2912575 RepID=UPI001F3DDF9E|nr:VWA domain-containing protein [Hyphobacterium sp. SN044]MCF8879326.1 VWA domain-containing protein [Hyphobacterium sp. SN044]